MQLYRNINNFSRDAFKLLSVSLYINNIFIWESFVKEKQRIIISTNNLLLISLFGRSCLVEKLVKIVGKICLKIKDC